MKLSALLLSLVFLTSCASYFKRKNCESTDWYQHGYKFAMQGKRLDADSFIKECRAVEAKVDFAAADTGFKAGMTDYCKEDSAYNKGYEGESYNYNFCSSNKKARIQGSFERGRDKLCSSGGYQFGASGKTYAGQCSTRGEEKFLKNFNRGRYKFLNNEIRMAKNEIYQTDRKIRNLQYEILNLQSQRNAMGGGQVIVRERKYDEFNRNYREEVKVEENPHVANEKMRLENIIRRKRSEVTSLKNKQTDLENKIREYQREITKIDR